MESDLEVVAEVARGDEVLAAVRATAPDVALLDIEMPGASGLELCEQLSAALALRVLILTTFGRPGYLSRAMQSGAAGFLLKDAPAAQLAAAIRRAVAGERIVDPGLAVAALRQGANPLTSREREVLAMARQQGTVAQLAASLHLARHRSQPPLRDHAQARRLESHRGDSHRRAGGLAVISRSDRVDTHL